MRPRSPSSRPGPARFAAAAALLAVAAGSADLGAQGLPPSGDEATERLNDSPRHGEWVEFDAAPEASDEDPVRAWVVYPERSDAAPVVVVIHEIFGLTDWIRAVADQLAADGFIAIAPDLLSGHGPDRGGSESVDQQEAVQLIRSLEDAEVNRRVAAAGAFAAALPAATDRWATMGFCWGGSTSFRVATVEPDLGAAVVFYGSSPETSELAGVRAPILGLYGGDDERVNATIDPAREELEQLGRRFEVEIYDGAGHGFLRQQEGRDGANLTASRGAWPRALDFLRHAVAQR